MYVARVAAAVCWFDRKTCRGFTCQHDDCVHFGLPPPPTTDPWKCRQDMCASLYVGLVVSGIFPVKTYAVLESLLKVRFHGRGDTTSAPVTSIAEKTCTFAREWARREFAHRSPPVKPKINGCHVSSNHSTTLSVAQPLAKHAQSVKRDRQTLALADVSPKPGKPNHISFITRGCGRPAITWFKALHNDTKCRNLSAFAPKNLSLVSFRILARTLPKYCHRHDRHDERPLNHASRKDGKSILNEGRPADLNTNTLREKIYRYNYAMLRSRSAVGLCPCDKPGHFFIGEVPFKYELENQPMISSEAQQSIQPTRY